MALTITFPLANAPAAKVEGGLRHELVKIQLDNSYPNTGTYSSTGYAITAAQVSMAEILWMNVAQSAGGSTTVASDANWDVVNGRLHLFDGTDGIEWENGTDFTAKGPGGGADFVYAEVWGH